MERVDSGCWGVVEPQGKCNKGREEKMHRDGSKLYGCGS